MKRTKSALSFYRSGELRKSYRGALLITAGRCTTTTTSTCTGCIEIDIQIN
jgi:hypothetical protein